MPSAPPSRLAVAGATSVLGVVGFAWLAWVTQGAPPAVDVRVHDDLWSARGPFLTGLAHVVTWAGSIYVLGPVLLLVGGVLPRTRVSLRRFAWLAFFTGAAVAARMLLQPWVGRPRPPTDGILSDGPGASLPSGHSVQIVVAVGLLYLAYAHHLTKRPRTACVAGGLGLVAVVAWSRLYLGVHWLTDVAAGIIVGVTLVAVAAMLEPWTERPDGRR